MPYTTSKTCFFTDCKEPLIKIIVRQTIHQAPLDHPQISTCAMGRWGAEAVVWPMSKTRLNLFWRLKDSFFQRASSLKHCSGFFILMVVHPITQQLLGTFYYRNHENPFMYFVTLNCKADELDTRLQLQIFWLIFLYLSANVTYMNIFESMWNTKKKTINKQQP